MRIALLLIYYNAKQELIRLLNSLPLQPTKNRSVDYIIAVDGLFSYTKAMHSDMPILSNDGSTELLRNSRFNVKIINCGDQTEVVKRNRYLEMCEKLDIDYGIICDSDEFFVYPDDCRTCSSKRRLAWSMFRNNFVRLVEAYGGQQNVFNIPMKDKTMPTQISQRPRCWYRPGDMRYIGNSHYHYANVKTEQAKIEEFRNKRMIYFQHSKGLSIVDGGISMCNDLSLRTKEQMSLREKYQRYLVAYESAIQTNCTHEEADAIASKYPMLELNISNEEIEQKLRPPQR